jgi:hypothetical protein
LSSINKANGKGVAEQMAKSEPFIITGHDEEEGDNASRGLAVLFITITTLCHARQQQFKRPNWQVFSTAKKKSWKMFHLHSFFDNASPCSSERASTPDSALFLGFACRRLARSLLV